MIVYRRRKSFLYALMAAVLIFLVCLVCSIILIVRQDYDMIIILFLFLFFIGGMFLFIALFEWGSYLEIDSNRIVFHYKVSSSDKGLRGFNRKGLSIEWKDVKLVNIRHIHGDKILASNTSFATFFLKDDRIFETAFYHFGRVNEQAIITSILAYVPSHQSNQIK